MQVSTLLLCGITLCITCTPSKDDSHQLVLIVISFYRIATPTGSHFLPKSHLRHCNDEWSDVWFDSEAEHGTRMWHIDGMNRNCCGQFSLLIGVFLNAGAGCESGNLCVWPGSHHTVSTDTCLPPLHSLVNLYRSRNTLHNPGAIRETSGIILPI